MALPLEAAIFLEEPPLPVLEALQPAQLTLVPFAAGVRIDALDGSHVQYTQVWNKQKHEQMGAVVGAGIGLQNCKF